MCWEQLRYGENRWTGLITLWCGDYVDVVWADKLLMHGGSGMGGYVSEALVIRGCGPAVRRNGVLPGLL